MGEGAEGGLVVGRRRIAAGGPHVYFIGGVVVQSVEGHRALGGRQAGACAHAEARQAILYVHRGPGLHAQGVPREGHRVDGEVVGVQPFEQAVAEAYLVDRHGAVADGLQCRVLSGAYIVVQAHHGGAALAEVYGVYGHEVAGLPWEFHGADHEARRARGGGPQGHDELAEGGPDGLRQHGHTVAVGGGPQQQHAAAGVEALIVGQPHAGGPLGAHRYAAVVAADTAHAEGVEAVGREARDSEGRQGGTYGVAAIGHLHNAKAVGVEMQRQLAAADMRHRGHRGAATLYAHVVNIHLCVVGLQPTFHAERQPSSAAAVGAEVHNHLLPARALLHMQRVEGHEGSRVASRVGAEAHQEARRRARGVEIEAQV